MIGLDTIKSHFLLCRTPIFKTHYNWRKTHIYTGKPTYFRAGEGTYINRKNPHILDERKTGAQIEKRHIKPTFINRGNPHIQMEKSHIFEWGKNT